MNRQCQTSFTSIKGNATYRLRPKEELRKSASKIYNFSKAESYPLARDSGGNHQKEKRGAKKLSNEELHQPSRKDLFKRVWSSFGRPSRGTQRYNHEEIIRTAVTRNGKRVRKNVDEERKEVDGRNENFGEGGLRCCPYVETGRKLALP